MARVVAAPAEEEQEVVAASRSNSSNNSNNNNMYVSSNELNRNDVLLGRGTGPSQYIGNVLFRELIKERRDEYTSIVQYKQKAKIAKQVMDKVHTVGGRFLKQVDKTNNNNRNQDNEDDEDDIWMVVDTATALEKCKQALREHRDKRRIGPTTSKRTRDGESSAAQVFVPTILATASASASAVVGLSGISSSSPSVSVGGDSSFTSASGRLEQQQQQVPSVVVPAIPPSPLMMSAVPSSMLLLSGRNDMTSSLSSSATTMDNRGAARLCLQLPTTMQHHHQQQHFVTSQQQQQSLNNSYPSSKEPIGHVVVPTETNAAQNGLLKALYGRYLEAIGISSSSSSNLHTNNPPDDANPSVHGTCTFQCQRQADNRSSSNNDDNDVAPTINHSKQRVDKNTTERFGLDRRESESSTGSTSTPSLTVDSSNTTTSSNMTSSSLCSSNSSDDDDDHDDDEIAAVVTLSALHFADRPQFTQQQEELEEATMTDEERAAVLADTFGKMCMSIHGRGMTWTKRPRRDLDQRSIDFLIQRMRREMDVIPGDQKKALLEAQVRARPQEFSDERLERFLRCDGMNAKLAAQRFVSYWEGRRQVFGPDKFVQRMTLSEALRDDLDAIQAGAYCLLPHTDLSGRQLLYFEPHRNTKQGYTTESMVRAFWYTMEVTSQENNDVGSGIVHVINDSHSTFADFDRKLFEPFLRHITNSWPIKSTAIHACCAPSLLLRVVKPILFALTNKSARRRVIVHDAPKSEIVESLAEFGILKGMIPTDLGGTIEINQSEWIAHRRALEMEEL